MKKSIFAIIVVLFTVNSCFYIDMNHFDQDDKMWLSSFNEGDTMLFQSPNDCDTLVVEEIYYNDSYFPFITSTARNVMNAYSYVEMTVHHKCEPIICMLALEKENEGTMIRINFNDKLEIEDKANIKLNHMTIGKENYDDVFLCTGKSSIFPQKEIECYYWSKSQGLIQYKCSNGDIYTLVN